MKDSIKVPSTVEKSSISILLLRTFSPKGAARAHKIQVICYTTWVSQPFPGTIPNMTFLEWEKQDNSWDCSEVQWNFIASEKQKKGKENGAGGLEGKGFHSYILRR